MNLVTLLKGSMLLVLGILVGIFLVYFQVYGLESPLSGSDKGIAPHDWISEDKIHIYKDKIVLDIVGGSLSRYADTGSMKPIFDQGANGIRIVPSSEENIHVGDIITFERDGLLIVHRVVEAGEDELGRYFITQGDNNTVSDGKVRFKDIKYVTIAVVY